MSYLVADLSQILRCPGDNCGDYLVTAEQLSCQTCGNIYQIQNEIVIMLKAANDH